jgi:threonine dehydratase/serine racemase
LRRDGNQTARAEPVVETVAVAAPAALEIPDVAAVRAAAERIAPWIRRTPVLSAAALDRAAGGRLHFKCEPFQRSGSFKFRGASNAVLSLSEEEARRGVVTHSSGNHGAALALAARERGIPAWVVMPQGAPAVKRAAVEGYGGRVVFCAPTPEARIEGAARVERETGAVLVHPYDDPRVIAGQGTAALELLDEVPDLDLLVAPVGGGGLLSGTAIVAAAAGETAAGAAGRAIETVGAEPAAADDAARSLASGRIEPTSRVTAEHPATIADGLRSGICPRTLAVMQTRVARIVTVPEEAIVAAMRTVWERLKVVTEPSAAVPVAALLGTGLGTGRRVGVILSGGNVDLDRLPWSG